MRPFSVARIAGDGPLIVNNANRYAVTPKAANDSQSLIIPANYHTANAIPIVMIIWHRSVPRRVASVLPKTQSYTKTLSNLREKVSNYEHTGSRLKPFQLGWLTIDDSSDSGALSPLTAVERRFSPF